MNLSFYSFYSVQTVQTVRQKPQHLSMHDPMLHWIRIAQHTQFLRRQCVPVALFTVCSNEGRPSTPLLARWRYLLKAQGVPMDRVCSRSPQVSGRYCRRMWLGTANKGVLMRAHTSHLSVQRFPPSGRSEQWRYEGAWGGQLLPEGRRRLGGREEPGGGSFAWFCFHSRWGRKCYLG